MTAPTSHTERLLRETMGARIAVLPGDGIGPEVTAQAVKVLRRIAEVFGHSFAIEEGVIGGAGIDVYGDPLPAATRAIVESSDAVLLGAVGGPRWDDPNARIRPEQGLLALRRLLGTFANLRPVQAFAAGRASSPLRPELLEGVDLVVVRELTGGLYFGDKRRWRLEDGTEAAAEECVYSEGEVERVVRVAGQLARTRRGRVSSIDKANVLETSRLWRAVATRVMRDEFPELELEHVLVDACAMHLVRDPRRFDVIVTENLFGDILTDEASVLAGSIGLLPSASLGMPDPGTRRRKGLYEPIHGSAPDLAGSGQANPVGTMLSAAMMLEWSFGLRAEARVLEAAVLATLDAGLCTPDVGGGYSTEAVGDAVAMRIHSPT